MTTASIGDGPPAEEAPTGLELRLDQVTRRSPGLSREAGVSRCEAGARLKVSVDTAHHRCMNDASAISDPHARTAIAAQNALSVSGLAVARLLIGMAAPLDGVRVQVVVERLDD